MVKAGKKLITLGARNVLIKGGHLKSKKVVDIYLNKRDLKILISISILSKSAASLATSNRAREYLSEVSVEKDLFALIFCC